MLKAAGRIGIAFGRVFPLIMRKEVQMLARVALGLLCIVASVLGAPGLVGAMADGPFDYLLLATKKTSTMKKEMSEAADAGYRFADVMGGETSFGGSEVVVVMSRESGADQEARYQYKLLATSKTSTMQKEIQEAGDAGFGYRGQTVFKTTFGGQEVVVILERELDREADAAAHEYKLLATKKTSTMQKGLREAGDAGFHFVGLTVASTTFGGNELVSILRRPVEE
jgi:hypothetical protein